MRYQAETLAFSRMVLTGPFTRFSAMASRLLPVVALLPTPALAALTGGETAYDNLSAAQVL